MTMKNTEESFLLLGLCKKDLRLCVPTRRQFQQEDNFRNICIPDISASEEAAKDTIPQKKK